jgi:hypothetical protein
MKTIGFTSPYFYDSKVQDLITKLNTLSWIENQYPICHMGKSEEGTFPEAYYNDGGIRNLRVMPEGNTISFFMIEGNIEQVEEFHYRVPLALYVWADLTKVYTTKPYDYTAELLKDVIGILDDNGCNDLVISVDEVFENFTYLQKVLDQNTMRPYTAFKISFSCLLTKCFAAREDEVIKITSASIYVGAGNNIVMMYFADDIDTGQILDAGDFIAEFSGGPVTITAITIYDAPATNNPVGATLNRVIAAGETGKITYVRGTTALVGLSGLYVMNFTQNVTV